MRWQRTARLAIAIFVVVFAGIVFFTLHRRTAVPPAAAPEEDRPVEADAELYNDSGVKYEDSEAGKLKFRLVAASHVGYADGRHKLGHIELTLPDRNGKTVVIYADEAVLTTPPDKQLGKADLHGNVRFATDDGLDVRAGSAVYDDGSGILTVPGEVTFTRGRMQGRGVGATYDKNRDVLWLLDQAHIVVAPDEAGQGAADVTAAAAGLARADHYVRLTGGARIVSEGRTTTADEVKIVLQDDGNTLEHIELRRNSRIVETGATARTMSARDIDLHYAPDGRTMQRATLVENAIVELPGGDGSATRRVAGRTIEMTMGPDGSTLTTLNASQDVQVDLPGAGDTPARQIRAATLQASGPPDAGLTGARFDGPVEYRETRGAAGKAPAIDRSARSERLILATKAGLGDIEQADFRGRFRFSDGSTIAEAPRALYHVNRDRIELSFDEREQGPTPFVNNGQFLVEARNIQLSPSSQTLTADTNVRSTLQPKRRAATNGGANASATSQEPRMPVMLDDDRPVYVAANRLAYDGVAEATYTGQARLWQDQSQSKIDADTIIINDRTGNLTARTAVRSSMLMEDVDPKTKQKMLRLTVATSDELVYDDDKRLAVYTGKEGRQANMVGAHGDVTADRIDLYLHEDGRQLERAEAHGRVVVKEGARIAKGAELVYTAATDTYVMTGNPVEAIERDAHGSCKKTLGTTLTFRRAVGSISADAGGLATVNSETIPCPAESRN